MVMDMMKKLNEQGMTVVMVTHYAELFQQTARPSFPLLPRLPRVPHRHCGPYFMLFLYQKICITLLFYSVDGIPDAVSKSVKLALLIWKKGRCKGENPPLRLLPLSSASVELRM